MAPHPADTLAKESIIEKKIRNKKSGEED